MSQLTNYGENKLADFKRGQTLTLPTNWHLALASAADDGSIAELSGTGYARVAVERSLAKWLDTQGAGGGVVSTGTTHATSNVDAISWGNPGSAWGTASHVGFMDASTGGNCWIWLPIEAIVITTGSPNPVQIAAGALQLTLGLTGGCSDYLANKLIDLIFRSQAFSWPATLYFALYTMAPTSAGGGTEVAGGSYARPSLVPSLTSLSDTQAAGSTSASSGTSGRISNNASITYPAPTADWGTVVAEGIRDAPSGGNLLFSNLLGKIEVIGGVSVFVPSPRTVSSGGPAPSHAPNTLGLTLA